MRRQVRLLAALAVLALQACAPSPPSPEGVARFTPASFVDLPGWAEDRQGEALAALDRSCARILALPADRPLGPPVFGTAAVWHEPCRNRPPPGASDDTARAFVERHFTPVAIADGLVADGLFTGYYEPLLRGSRKPDGPYTTPLLARPNDLVAVDLGRFREAWRGERIAGRVVDGALKPYETRAQIEAGALAGRARPLVYVDDPVDAFFLHIQGSGRVRLAEGGEMRVGYAAQNGQPYVPVGRVLVDRGALAREAVSMQSIRAWMAANPDGAAELMGTNPSYVFFREISGDGPIGSEGVALTAARSLAVDRGHIALGTPVWLDAADPLDATHRVRRLMMAQDTGGAIRGVVRGDVFWGTGAEAGERAGRMRSAGRLWVLLPKPLVARLGARD
jgi:membrane-bound lytic murein transglycosylase A